MIDPRTHALAEALNPGGFWPSNQDLGGDEPGPCGDEYRRKVVKYAGELLAITDATDADQGVQRVEDLTGKLSRLATWLLNAGIVESLDVLDILSKGDIEAAMRQIETT